MVAIDEQSASRRRPTAVAAAASRRSAAAFLLLLMGVFTLMPLVWVVFASTKSTQTLYDSPGFWFGEDTQLATNISDLFTYQDGIFLKWIVNSFIYAFGAGIASTLFSTMAGFAFAKYRFWGKNTLFAIILASLMVPPAALALPIFLVDRQLGWINSYWGVLVPLIASPFGVFFMRAYISAALPDEILDAGRVDGATEFQLFRNIALRVLQPGVFTLFLITVVGIWNNFFLPLIVLSDSEKFPLTLGLAVWNSQTGSIGSEVLYPLVITGTLVSIVPLVVLFLFLRRFIVSGMMQGGLK